jgi:hypothetical protein
MAILSKKLIRPLLKKQWGYTGANYMGVVGRRIMIQELPRQELQNPI